MTLELRRKADGTIFVPSLDFGRLCVRCGEDAHPTDGEHLCKDVLAGLRLQTEADFRWLQRELEVFGGEG